MPRRGAWMSKLTDKIRRLHSSRVRAVEKAQRDARSKTGVYHADDVVESDAVPRRGGESSSQVDAQGHGERPSRPVDQAVQELRTTVDFDYQFDHLHGRYRIRDAFDVTFPLRIDHQLKLFQNLTELSRVGFFDIETDGLENGAIAFCIGLGRIVDDAFRVRQCVMVDEDDEERVLRDFARELEAIDVLVSFNGQSFDLPRVEARMQHYQIESTLREVEHVDLLVAARRFLPRQPSLTLSALERSLLAYHRVDDLPGSEAPARWKTFVRTGCLSQQCLLEVYEHNRMDIVSLLTLLVHFDRLVSTDSRPAGEGVGKPAQAREVHSATSGARRVEGELTKRLKKVYRLKQSRGSTRSSPNPVRDQEVVRPLQLVDDPPNSHAEVADRLRALRREAAHHLAQGAPESAVPLLHQMVSLSPRDPYPIAKLAQYYAGVGDEALASVFEERLARLAPY